MLEVVGVVKRPIYRYGRPSSAIATTVGSMDMSVDELDLLLGRIARVDVAVEFQLRQLWIELVVPSAAIALVPDNLRMLADNISRMLKSGPVPPERQALCQACLDEAKSAHKQRGDVLHQLWTPPTEPDTSWTRQKFGTSRDRLGNTTIEMTRAEVEAVLARLERIHARCWMLPFAVMEYTKPGMAGPQDLWEIVADNFTFVADGGIVVND